MKKPYEKPFITKQHGGIVNKFGGLTHTSIRDEIDGVKVSDLTAKFGSPLFVYSEKTIKKTYGKLMDSFCFRYPHVQHAWSYKTNYLKAVCKTFHKLGSWAEVVSVMEYDMARLLGVNPGNIIFNGPFKPYDGLREAVKSGAKINIDTLDELYDIEQLAKEIGSSVDIGMRLTMSLGQYMAWDRYGFDIDSGQAYQAVKRIVSGGKVNLAGLHSHIGTFILDPDIYRIEVEKLIAFCKAIKNEFGVNIKHIDIGGGFPSHNKLKGTYLSTADMIPKFERYAEAVCEPLLSAFPPKELPLLILESGRSMIDEAGLLISTVSATKRLSSGTRAIVIDAGVNLLFTAFWYDHEIIPTVDRGYPLEDHIIYGPLCMQIDLIRPAFKFPSLEKGDRIIIKPVGAYNNTQWMQFINLRPNVVMISEKGEVALIREAETVEYIQEREKLPQWLKD